MKPQAIKQKLHIRKGDKVAVIAGDEKGKEGIVLSVVTDTNKAFVEGLNKVKRSIKPTASTPQGSIVEKEAPIHVSNLSLIDPKSKKPTRVGTKIDAKGNKTRVSVKSGEVI